MAKKVEYICDIKGCEKVANNTDKKMQVIFHTEQTEGRPTAPHFSTVTMDICEGHFSKALSGKYIHAKGAQGHNRYYFQSNKN